MYGRFFKNHNVGLSLHCNFHSSREGWAPVDRAAPACPAFISPPGGTVVIKKKKNPKGEKRGFQLGK